MIHADSKAVLTILTAAALLLAGCAGGTGKPDQEEKNIARLELIGQRKLAEPADIEFLLQRLGEGSSEERMVAAWAIGETGTHEGSAPLIDAARNDADTPVRVNAIAALGKLDTPEVLPALTALLDDPEEEILLATLRSLAAQRFAPAAGAVGALYETAGPAVRGMAVGTLSRMQDAAALPHLVRALAEEDADLRGQAAFGLGKLGDSSAVQPLAPLLQDASWEVRANAVQALGMIGDSSARGLIEPLADDPNSQVRAVAEMALEKLGR